MRYLITAVLFLVGVIDLLPLSGVLGANSLPALYGATFTDPNILMLMRHRAVLFGFAVIDLEAAVEKAVTSGARLEAPVQSFVWGRQACLSDPFGNGFCLLQWQGSGYDAVAQAG